MLNTLIKIRLGWLLLIDKFWSYIYKKAMKECGQRVYLRPTSSNFQGLKNLSIGNDCIIPKNSTFFCTNAPLTIGNKVIFGPNPTIITGDHRFDVVGKYIVDTIEKQPENDQAVTIEDDVWCGANVTILKGVTIGKGSVIAAGCVVTRSCPPYSILVGVPAKVIRKRFSEEQIISHEKIINC